NLSLLTPARNPQIEKLGFDKKRERLRASLLKLNQEIAAEPEWDEDAIKRRERGACDGFQTSSKKLSIASRNLGHARSNECGTWFSDPSATNLAFGINVATAPLFKGHEIVVTAVQDKGRSGHPGQQIDHIDLVRSAA